MQHAACLHLAACHHALTVPPPTFRKSVSLPQMDGCAWPQPGYNARRRSTGKCAHRTHPAASIDRAPSRRDGRAVEGARLESVYTVKRIVGSNPTPSATGRRLPSIIHYCRRSPHAHHALPKAAASMRQPDAPGRRVAAASDFMFCDRSSPKGSATFPHRVAPADPEITTLVIVHVTEITALTPSIRPDAEDRYDDTGEP